MIGRRIALGSIAASASAVFRRLLHLPARDARANHAAAESARDRHEHAAGRLAEVLHGSSESFPATYLDASNDEYLFSVPLRSTTSGMRTTTLRNRIAIPATDVVQIETRKLSTWRTATVAATVMAGVTAAALVAFGGDAKADVEKRGDVDENRVPLVRWSIPIGR